MFFIFTLVVESFITPGAGKSICPRVLRFMVLFSLNSFEHFTTIITRISFTLVAPHVQLVVVNVIVSFSANTTEMRVVPSMVLAVPIESTFSIEYFVTFITFPYFKFCTQTILLQTFIPLFHFLLSELNMQNKGGYN